jgi:hypothetical protein
MGDIGNKRGPVDPLAFRSVHEMESTSRFSLTPRVMRLYEISAEIGELLESVDENGEFLPGVFERLEEAVPLAKDGIESLAKFLLNLRYEAEAFKKEAERMAQKAKAREARAERVSAFALDCMKRAGLKKIEGAVLSVSTRPSYRVEITDAGKIPAEFMKTKIETSVDKEALKKHLKEHGEADYAKIMEHENLVVK